MKWHNLYKSLIIGMIILCMATKGNAQDIFVTNVSTQIAIGGANVLDTYLSPEKYRGAEYRFISEVNRDSRKYKAVTYNLTHEGAFAYLHNRAVTAHEYVGHYDFSYAVMRRWRLADDRLQLAAGAMADAFVGFNYNNRNSNNPAQGYGSLALGARFSCSYSFTLFHKCMTVNYEGRVPLFGIMFSPNYGQSYYEMFNRGNYDHNIVAYSVSPFQLRHQLSLDIPIAKRTALRIGYLGDIRQAEPNNLKQHHYYNAATVGVVIRK